MKKLFFLSICFILISCVEHQDKTSVEENVFTAEDRVEVKYAKGFEVSYHQGYIKIITQSHSSNSQFKDSLFLITDLNNNLPKDVKRLTAEKTEFACQSSTYLAFFDAFKALDMVKALCGIKFVNQDSLKAELVSNGVVELCLTDQVQDEALLEANPDLFLIYPFGRSQDNNYKEKGINTLLIGEYLEETQIARLEWIKLFGLLLNRAEEANLYFDKIHEEYEALKRQVKPIEKSFIMNLPFQDQWFMPSAQSVGVRMVEDAGISYYFKEARGTENEVFSKEAIWDVGTKADYWIIIANRKPNFSLNDLLSESPVYKTFKSVKNEQVIFCNTADVDYFAKGIIEPQIILKDLLYATKQIEYHTPVYFKRLK